MKRIFSNLTAYFTYILAIIALFGVQSYGILRLTDTCSDIRVTGNDTGGITYLISDAMTTRMHDLLEDYLSPQEKMAFENSYELKDDGNYYIKKDVQFEDTLQELEMILMPGQAVAYKVMNMSETEYSGLVEENRLLPNDHMQIRDLLEQKIEEDPTESLKSLAWGFVRSTLSVSGRTEEQAKTAYLIRCFLRIFISLILIAGSGWGAASIYLKMRHLIFSRMPDRDLRSAQLMLVTLTCTAGYAMILVAEILLETGRIVAMNNLVYFLVLLVICALILAAVLKLPACEGFCKFWYRFADLNKYKQNLFGTVFYAIPLILICNACYAYLSFDTALRNMIDVSAAILLINVFYLPAIAEQAMIIEDAKTEDYEQDWY